MFVWCGQMYLYIYINMTFNDFCIAFQVHQLSIGAFHFCIYMQIYIQKRTFRDKYFSGRAVSFVLCANWIGQFVQANVTLTQCIYIYIQNYSILCRHNVCLSTIQFSNDWMWGLMRAFFSSELCLYNTDEVRKKIVNVKIYKKISTGCDWW